MSKNLPKIESEEDYKLVEEALSSTKNPRTPKNKKPKKTNLEGSRGANLRSLLDFDAIQAEQARRHLNQFIKQAWQVLEPTNPYVHNWHIDAICEHLEALAVGSIKNLLINVPPRHSKSLVASVAFPAWVWATWPEMRFIYAGYALTLSRHHSQLFRTLVTSNWYRKNWQHVFGITSDNITEIQNDKTGYRLVSAVGASVIGRGGNFVVVDDPHDPREGAEGSVVREKALLWWDNVMSTRFEGDPKEGRRLIIMQRIHDNDLSGHVLKQAGYTHLNLPMEYVPSKKCQTDLGWSDPRTFEGELLNPERFDQKWVDFQSGSNKTGANPNLTRRMSSSAYAGQFQQNPVPEGGGIIKEAWLKDRYYKVDPQSVYNDAEKVILTVDCSFKDSLSSDYVVMQVWGRIRNNLYLIAMNRARMSFVETIVGIRGMISQYPKTQEKLIEDKANGPAVIQVLQKQLQGVIAHDPGSSSKEERLNAVSWIVEAGNVYLPDPEVHQWSQIVVDEVTRFPASEFDDIVDAFIMALQRLQLGVIDPNMVPIGVGEVEGRNKEWSHEDSPSILTESPFTRGWNF